LENVDQFHCEIAAILNITPDHLDRHASFEDYTAAKIQIFKNQGPADTAILNADNRTTASIAKNCAANSLMFSRKYQVPNGASLSGSEILISREGRAQANLNIRDIRLRGTHNLENVLAATLVGISAGLETQQMEAAVKEFRGVEHRLEFVDRIEGVDYFNDSKATNVDSAERALSAFSDGVILIMGGLEKGGDFTTLVPLVEERVKRLILLGEATPLIRSALKESVDPIAVASLQEAVDKARFLAEPGDTVLLSPGCASFDMFENFEDRGRQFKEAVGSLQINGRAQPK
jgi:UDP-N-acetylmuramoylalanine--D-glutamate ligase